MCPRLTTTEICYYYHTTRNFQAKIVTTVPSLLFAHTIQLLFLNNMFANSMLILANDAHAYWAVIVRYTLTVLLVEFF